jgi:hypothetical protein
MSLNSILPQESKMGINLAIVLSHRLSPPEIKTFAEHASVSPEMQRTALRLWDVMHVRWSNLDPIESFTKFRADEYLSDQRVSADWERHETPRFEWAGFSLYFGRNAVLGIHLEKLIGFVLNLDDCDLQTPLLDCIRALARELQSPMIIIGPDCFSNILKASEVADGSSLTNILNRAKRICGKQVSRIRDMANSDEELHLDQHCYYVESVTADEK